MNTAQSIPLRQCNYCEKLKIADEFVGKIRGKICKPCSRKKHYRKPTNADNKRNWWLRSVAKMLKSGKLSSPLNYVVCKYCKKTEAIRPTRTYPVPDACFICSRKRAKSSKSEQEFRKDPFYTNNRTVGLRQCRTCEQWKSINAFYSKGSGRKSAHCGACEAQAAYEERHGPGSWNNYIKKRAVQDSILRQQSIRQKRIDRTPCDIYVHSCLECGGLETRRIEWSTRPPYCRGCITAGRNRDRAELLYDSVKICGRCGLPMFVHYGAALKVHPECSQAYERAVRKRHKAYRRALKIGASKRGLVVDPMLVFKRDKWRCRMCGIRTQKTNIYADNAAELDHIVPVSKGGLHIPSNLQCLCRKCNITKSDRLLGQVSLFSQPTQNRSGPPRGYCRSLLVSTGYPRPNLLHTRGTKTLKS